MAWMNTKGAGSLGKLASAFEKQKATVGHMPGPPKLLHQTTMAPTKGFKDTGATKGNSAGFGQPMAGALGGRSAANASMPAVGGSTSVQSPAQHNAVEKAAQASAAKRRRGF